MMLQIVGLGPGSVEDITRRAWAALETAHAVYLRTKRHPCVTALPNYESYHSFDTLYEQAEQFEQVYATIAGRVLDAARNAPAGATIVYAVPGDPLVGEATTALILNGAKAQNIPVQIIHGISFIEPALALVGVDALEGVQLLDALEAAAMHHPPLNPDKPALIGQVYSAEIASNLKLTLMNQYADDFEVVLIYAAGTADALAERLPLYALDRSKKISHLTALYVPAVGNMSSFEQFQEIIAHLRAPEGCPWDQAQTHLTLRPFLIEETYEVLEALDNQNPQALSEELGDLLLQIVLHTQVAIDDGEFRMTDVLRHINAKMIRRHPHVWGDISVQDAAQVLTNWEMLKQQEHQQKGDAGRKFLLDGIPKGLPALQQAYRYQAKAAKVGFDWEQIEDVLAKLHEELAETRTADTPEARTEEVGDLLFVLVNYARWLGVADIESALRAANAKFYRRFRFIEEAALASGKALEAYTLAEMDSFWNAAKAQGL